MSSNEKCIRAERSLGTFILFESKINVPYYKESKYQTSYHCSCYGEGYCLLLNGQNSIFTTNYIWKLNDKQFDLMRGIFDYDNDSIQFDGSVNSSCKYSKKYCNLPQKGSDLFYVWNTNKCHNFPKIGRVNVEIWTILKDPLIQVILIQNGPDSYLLHLGDTIQSKVICLKGIRKTNIPGLFVQETSSNTTDYTLKELSNYNVPKTSIVFCRNESNVVESNNLSTSSIVIIAILVLLIVETTILIYLKQHHLIMILQKLNDIYKIIITFDENKKIALRHSVEYVKDNKKNEEMIENSFYSSTFNPH